MYYMDASQVSHDMVYTMRTDIMLESMIDQTMKSVTTLTHVRMLLL